MKSSKIAAVAATALIGIGAAGCASTTPTSSTTHSTATHQQATPAAAPVNTTPQRPAACTILKGDWNRTRTHLQAGDFAYAGGAWADIAKDFQALGMNQQYKASEDVAAILIDYSIGESITPSQERTLKAGIKILNYEGTAKCGTL